MLVGCWSLWGLKGLNQNLHLPATMWFVLNLIPLPGSCSLSGLLLKPSPVGDSSCQLEIYTLIIAFHIDVIGMRSCVARDPLSVTPFLVSYTPFIELSLNTPPLGRSVVGGEECCVTTQRLVVNETTLLSVHRSLLAVPSSLYCELD